MSQTPRTALSPSRHLVPAVEGKRVIGRVLELSLEKSAVAGPGSMDFVLNVVRSLWEVLSGGVMCSV